VDVDLSALTDQGLDWLTGQIIDHPEATLVAIGVVLVMVLIVLHWISPSNPKPQTGGMKALPPVRTSGTRPKGPMFVPLPLAQVTIDLQPRRGASLHMGVVGPTGLGKSSAVTPLFDLGIGVWCIALDNTRPIRNKVLSVGGTDWTNDPRECQIGLDLLNISTPEATAELIISGLPKVKEDSGQWRRQAIARLVKTLRLCEQAGIERNWNDLVRALYLKTGDIPADRACGEWGSKLEAINLLFGPSFGTDLNLVNAMRNREKVLTRTNHFLSTELGPMVGGWLMLLARLVAHEANIPFVLIVEEANQAELFAKHITPISQAARDRDVVGVWIGQNGSKLPDEVVQNTKVWVCSGQGIDTEQRFCASRLKLKPEQLDIDAFPKARIPSDQGIGWFYVRAPGVATTLVHLPEPKIKTAPGPSRKRVVSSDVGVSDWDDEPAAAINNWHPWQPALTAPSEDAPEPSQDAILSVEPEPAWLGNDDGYRRMWSRCRRLEIPSLLWCPCHGLRYDARGCLEWAEAVSNPPNAPARPRTTYRRKEASPYREFYKLANGQYPRPTADHLCANPLCCEVSHLEPCEIDENKQRESQRTRLFKDQGWVKVERMYRSGGMRKPVRVIRWEGELPAAA
jgi:hypothetical protein